MTVFYAYKQQTSVQISDEALEDEAESPLPSPYGNARASSGWETMLSGLIQAGFSVVGTYPMRTESRARLRAQKSNALASSVVLVCRPRPEKAPSALLSEFLQALREELPLALRELQKSNIAPVDLAQAAVGIGIKVYSSYSSVYSAKGRVVGVAEALAIINRVLDEYFEKIEAALDTPSRLAVNWFRIYGFSKSDYGHFETLVKAKNVYGEDIESIFDCEKGNARLRDLSFYYDRISSPNDSAWVALHILCSKLVKSGILETMDSLYSYEASLVSSCKNLAYTLYHICESNRWAREGELYNYFLQSCSLLRA
ncbi:MAG: hypothetical protein D6735_01150 [Acidobacteria bacterium]|nr:MAG: hypothetical protein D6735_01150 [Acidobacteriota bacterium]